MRRGVLLAGIVLAGLVAVSGRRALSVASLQGLSSTRQVLRGAPGGGAYDSISVVTGGNVEAGGARFEDRCHAPGVLKCIGFDSLNEVQSRLRPNAAGRIQGFLDTSIKVSGSGSLRFEVPSLSGPNSAGSWDTELGRTFGPGDTFYVQFRQRFDRTLLKENFQGGGWKQIIVYGSPSPCGKVELATQNEYYRGFPQMFTDCGARDLYQSGGAGPILLQQGDYNCEYGRLNPQDCSYYRADQWMTFYYKTTIGQWGKPTSSVEAWVAYEGEPLKKFINFPNLVLNFDHGAFDRFDRLLLSPYDTNKPANSSHPIANTWYDELIVSTRPIAAPIGNGAKK